MLPRLSLLAAGLATLLGLAHASEAIPEPTAGRSATVTQPHVTAELISEVTDAHPSQPFDIALHLHMDENWHTYWINPGDAGLATSIKWTLPPGWTAGPIQWPTPEKHMMGPLTTYGYGGDVYLLTTITPPKFDTMSSGDFLHAHATWLVCQEECIPGKADLQLQVDWQPGSGVVQPTRKAFFDALRSRLPVPNTRWDVSASYQPIGLADAAVLRLTEKQPGAAKPVGQLEFLAEQPNVIAPKNGVNPPVSTQGDTISVNESLAQNGQKPPALSGVLISDTPLIGDAKSVYLSSFPVSAASGSMSSASLLQQTSAPATTTATPSSTEPPPTLLVILALAFLGGLILNLMPCVLPVLSLKVFSLIKHAGEGGAWKQGLAFTAGVLVSFWILAGLLIALESAGSHLGWGFQMQSPGFVLALIFLFFLLGLNLFGVFELGTSLVGLDAKATSHIGGLTSSFANGALATLAATPCTAPFMGSAVGFAAQQPAAISLLVFTALAFGMAAPYLALTIFPGALKLVPKPGAWMETLKQFMGFLLMGTVIFLAYVFGALVGNDRLPELLAALLIVSLAAWIYGRYQIPAYGIGTRRVADIVAALFILFALFLGVDAITGPIESNARLPATQTNWQPWSPAAVQQALAQGRPVFVDFTAAWCLSCKVNEAVALDIDSTKQLFAQKHVALFRGDWTQSDPRISDTLRQYNRNGVPLYLVYSPRNPDAPQVLPEVLTPGIVRDALQKLP